MQLFSLSVLLYATSTPPHHPQGSTPLIPVLGNPNTADMQDSSFCTSLPQAGLWRCSVSILKQKEEFSNQFASMLKSILYKNITRSYSSREGTGD